MENISGSLRRYDEDHEKKGEDYTTQELEQYCEHADDFFQIWIELHGAQFNTNCVHMIGSGNMYNNMFKWGNLTKYSQQGWEALNVLIKLFFFQRTNKGGKHSGTLTQLKSKLIPIAKLLQRLFFWVCNLVPTNLWDDGFVMPQQTSTKETFSDPQETDNLIFDTGELIVQGVQF